MCERTPITYVDTCKANIQILKAVSLVIAYLPRSSSMLICIVPILTFVPKDPPAPQFLCASNFCVWILC